MNIRNNSKEKNKEENIPLRGILFYTCSQWEFTGCFDIIPSETRQAKNRVHTLLTTKTLLVNFARITLLTLVSRLTLETYKSLVPCRV